MPFFIDFGKKQFIISSKINHKLINLHAKLMNLKINIIRIQPDSIKFTNNIGFNFIFEKIINEVFKNNHSKKDKIYYISSNDYQEEPPDKLDNNKVKEICKREKITFISFKKIIKKDSTFAPIKLMLKEGIKACIVACDNTIDKTYLSKLIDNNFLQMLKKEMKSGNKVDANSYQSFVIKSPLFNGKEIKILKTDYTSHIIDKKRQHFIEIKNYAIQKASNL